METEARVDRRKQMEVVARIVSVLSQKGAMELATKAEKIRVQLIYRRVRVRVVPVRNGAFINCPVSVSSVAEFLEPPGHACAGSVAKPTFVSLPLFGVESYQSLVRGIFRL